MGHNYLFPKNQNPSFFYPRKSKPLQIYLWGSKFFIKNLLGLKKEYAEIEHDLERLFAVAEPTGAERKILPGKEANCRDDVQADDGIPPFTTLSLLSFISFVRLASPQAHKPGHY
jgi:hypothetical protein